MQSRFHQSWSFLHNHPAAQVPPTAQAFQPGFQRAMWHGYHRRGPSRVLWFLIGGGVFAWWYHHNERKQAIKQGKVPEAWGWHGQHGQCGNKWGRDRWLENENQQQQPTPVAPVAAGTAAAVATDEKAQPTPAAPVPQQIDPWEAERQKMKQVGQQSMDAV
ncbi:hypothetical protein CALVIDRAFT_533965 [Calocera viscosa TUFC12733]|uniref:Uncharacterized protein n=1 Tax=Calocera viscosa (strain TUFC12733) TaxID=1330018 RepID=A0A167QWR4_CALVF|nr:hypothetical protein CALVIDRAFT_533965 [Calocera viscosa TUFC12733]